LRGFGRPFGELNMSLLYDYLIVGCGLTGATLARILTDKGKKVLIIDQNNYIGGACYTKIYDQLPVCQFGGHTFHTSNDRVWDFVNRFQKMIPYSHRIKARIGYEYYSIPINMMTLNKIYGFFSIGQAKLFFKQLPFVGDNNFEERAISTIGEELYKMFFYHYTKKQWNMEPKNLPAFIFSRLPVRYDFDDRYFHDYYQAQPEFGYTNLIENMLNRIEVKLNTPFDNSFKNYDKLIYTGSIDKYFDYRCGKLGYRSIENEWHIGRDDNFGTATTNYCGPEVDFTRTVTFNHFYPHIQNSMYVTSKEKAIDGGIPFYPIPIKENLDMYNKYKEIPTDTIFAGRLGGYKYINMDQAVKDAMELAEKL
jgi:UDP-galactopyranose mutase